MESTTSNVRLSPFQPIHQIIQKTFIVVEKRKKFFGTSLMHKAALL